jgi:hypothetical protein
MFINYLLGSQLFLIGCPLGKLALSMLLTEHKNKDATSIKPNKI